MKAKAGVNKDNVFSKLCQAGFDSVVTGGRSIELKHKGYKTVFKDHTYRFYPLQTNEMRGRQKWVQLQQWQVVLQLFNEGKIPKNHKPKRVRV